MSLSGLHHNLNSNNSENSKLEIITDENEQKGPRGTKRYTNIENPNPSKVKKSNGYLIGGFFGLFRDWFRGTENENTEEEMEPSPSRILNSSNCNTSRSRSSSGEIIYDEVVNQPEVICTTSRKSALAAVPKQINEQDDSSEEVEVVGEIYRTPPGTLNRAQHFIEEAIKTVEDANIIQIEEQESSSDSISVLTDNLDEIKSLSPAPDDSVSRQHTPNRFRTEDFQTPADTWSRKRRPKYQTPRSRGEIPRVLNSTPVSKSSRLKKFHSQAKPSPMTAYHTPSSILRIIGSDAGLIAYDKIVKQCNSSRFGAGISPRSKAAMDNRPMRPLDYLLRAKAAMRRHKSRQASECVTIDDDNKSSTSSVEYVASTSRATSEAPSFSSYHSTGREKVDDLIANLNRVDIGTGNVLNIIGKYQHEKKFREHKELELKETSKQITEIRDLHATDLIEDVRQRLFLTGIRPPLPRKKEKEEFPELPPEAYEICNRAWGGGHSEEVFCEGFDTKIMRRDLETLRQGKWLNDEVITFYLNLIVERSKNDESLPKVYTFNTFFYVNISTKGYASVKRWTRKVDIFAHDILLIPVHVGKVHWCMATVDFEQKTIEYFDPMHYDDNGALCCIKQYLSDESKDKKKKDFDFSGWSFNERLDCPQQQNGYDCGVFSTHFAEYCARRAALTFSQEHMDYFRKRTVFEIVTKKLM